MSLAIARRFALFAEPISSERYGNGHINDSYLVRCQDGHRYLLQRMNRHAFPDIDKLMENVRRVTNYLSQFDPDGRHTLHLVPDQSGAIYHLDEEGEAWRVYEFVERSLCFEKIENREDFYQSAIAFGTFQKQLAAFPAETLHEVIERFHDTPHRFEQLKSAVEADSAGHKALVSQELDFALAREAGSEVLVEGMQKGMLPTRVTHNDTKLNNVLFDETTRLPLCVIDLDTVMPGAMAFDFGDSIRFGASTAAEDEPDLEKVHFSIDLFETYAQGFLAMTGKEIDQNERMSLADGARLMTLECGIRFLADYLNGDVYFHTAYPEHNLVRARTQFKLVREMENQRTRMEDILATI